MNRIELFRLWQTVSPDTYDMRITQMFNALTPAQQAAFVGALKTDVLAVLRASKDDASQKAQDRIDEVGAVT